MLYRLIGFWVLRRAYRIVTADDPRSLSERLGAEGKRILMGAEPDRVASRDSLANPQSLEYFASLASR